MNKQEIFKELGNYKKILEEKGYNVIYIGLYGSQNYNLDDEESDIDAKAIILPSLHDIIFRKVTSKVVECEKGNIDVKDLLTEFEKWGFDPKQHHHIHRLFDLLLYNNNHDEFLSYLAYNDDDMRRKQLMNFKRNKDALIKSIVEEDSDLIIENAKKLIPEGYVYEPTNVDDEINKYIEDKIKIELRNTNVSYAREYRTFDTPIPKKDLDKFPILAQYDGKDISYIVTESIEIL